MASTGEVACYGDDRWEAYLKAIISAGFRVPKRTIFLSGDVTESFVPTMKSMVTQGYKLFNTPEVSKLLKEHKIASEELSLDSSVPKSALQHFKEKKIDLAINFPYKFGVDLKMSETMRLLRRQAINFNIPIMTNQRLAEMTMESLARVGKNMHIKSWADYFPEEQASAVMRTKSQRKASVDVGSAQANIADKKKKVAAVA